MLRFLWHSLLWAALIVLIIVYPILISVYVTLPLFIGFAGYLFLLGLEGKGIRYLLFPTLYLLNLEINLFLPMLLSILSVLIYYLLAYPHILILKRCKVCIAVISVLGIDVIYLMLLLAYDFIFSSSSVGVNPLLFYSLVFDIIAAVLL